MKNFTNNFKQFTSRLSARWLIMALMMLMGTSSAWATVYLKGSWNWNEGIAIGDGGGSCSVTLNGNTTYWFYINNYYGNQDHNHKANGTMTSTDCTDWWFNGDQDCAIETTITGTYTFKYYWKDGVPVVSVEYPEEEACTIEDDSKIRIELETGGSYTYLYAWYKNNSNVEIHPLGNWPGSSEFEEGQSLLNSDNVKYIEILRPNNTSADKKVSIIFNNNNGTQTGDITNLSFGKVYRYNNDGTLDNSDCLPPDCEETEYNISFAGNVTSINKGATLLASVNPSGTGYGTVTWESETPSVATIDASGVITGVKFGTSTITATVADGDTYCGGTATETITVKETPTITIDGETEFCGESTTLTATIGNITGGNSYNIKWYEDGNNTEKVTGSAFSPTKSGTYIVKVTGKFVNETSKTVVVTKKAYPTAANFTVTNNNYTYDGAAKAATVKWTDNQSAEGITVTYNPATPKDAGIYDIQVTTTAHGDLCASNGAITLGDKLTINKADQTTALTITASTNICGKEATFSVTGGDGTGDYSYSLDKNDAGVSLNGTTLTATQNGSVTLKVKKLGDTNYNDSEEAVKEFNFTMPIENVNLSIIKGLSASGDYCVGTEIQLKLTYTGATPANDGSHLEWVKDGFSSEIGNNEGGIATGATWTTTLGVNDKTLKVKLKDCNEGWVESNELTFNVFERPEAPKFNPNYMTVCQGQAFTLPGSENEGYIWSDAQGKPTTPNKPSGIDETSQYYAVISFGCPSDATLYTVNVNKIPTITGASVTQTNKEITLESAAGADTEWSVSPTENVTLTDNGDGTATFVATANGNYTITASNGICAQVSHTIKVSDAFYIYFRNAKKGETAYANFYDPNRNTEEVRGGEMFYAECDALPTNGNNSLPTHFVNYNKGGRKADIITTDCDGYTWYGFKASAEVVAGAKYFYVHATNDINYNGHYTHTVPTQKALTSDVYYTLGTTNHTTTHYGWNITLASAPYAGPKVHASGSTALGTNKFAALYVTDCSGKEITGYQWYKDGVEYVSKCEYTTKDGVVTGDAGKTNNIRPSELGYYRCKVTYKDGSTVTSEPVQVTGSYTHASSTLPVIIVNTNGVGFPVNNFGGTPSKNADEMKAKRSVDVKIYQGKTMVYDRKARMNYRGSSSLNFLKKSYAFCPGKDNCVEDKGRQDYVKTEKMNMLGIGTAKDKDWVLYAAAADPSLMRNRLMFDTFRDMTGGWSVNSRYVELYVDGEYKGVYVMMDKVTKNEGRVNITDPNGFIVKFDKTDLVDRYEADGDKKTFKSLYSGYDGESGNGMKTYDTYIDQRFEIEYPEMEDVEEDNPGMWAKTVNDIKTIFNNFESNLKAGNYAEVQKIIDYTSWADWFIISEYAKNMDAYRASCIFVYDGDKIEARPLWDQELSFNNQCANLCSTYGCNSTTGLLIENSKIYEEGCSAPFWFTGKYVGGRGTEAKSGAQFEGYLLNDPCFIAVLKERWALHTATGGALTKDVMTAKISGYETDLGAIGTANTPFNRELGFWSGKSRETIDCGTGSGCYDGSTGYSAYNTQTNISNSVTLMKNWINGNRRTNLGTLITNMKGSPLSISFMPQEVTTTPWEPITLQVVNTSSYDYTITYTDGELDKQSGVIINKTDDTFKINVPRPDKWGIGNEKVEGERADITYGIKATLNVADGTTVCGKSEVTPATATIILQDEPNEDCNNN